MTSPDAARPTPPPAVLAAGTPPRKRRPWWLFAPHVAVALIALGLCGGWLWLRSAALAALADAPTRAAAAGAELRIGDATVTGFPFRLRVALGGLRLARGGWAVEAPAVVAQAYVYAPTHWVVVAPQGLTVVRPQGGALVVSGHALRASISASPGAVWRVALVGEGVTFATPPGAHAFSLQRAERVEAYLKPHGPDAAFLLGLTRAQPTPGSLVWRLSPTPLDAVVEGRLTPAAAFSGPAPAAAWARAGGALAIGHVEAKGGPTQLSGAGGALMLDGEGRLVGAVPLRLTQSAPLIASEGLHPLAAPSAADKAAPLDLVFGDGAVRLGPFRVGPQPKVG